MPSGDGAHYTFVENLIRSEDLDPTFNSALPSSKYLTDLCFPIFLLALYLLICKMEIKLNSLLMSQASYHQYYIAETDFGKRIAHTAW